MDFGDALKVLRGGGSMCRRGWNGMGMALHLRDPVDAERFSSPYLYLLGTDGVARIWTASQTDLLADDWQPGQSPGPSRTTLTIMGDILDKLERKAPDRHHTNATYPHKYPGIRDGRFRQTTSCDYGCKAWMGGTRSGAPDGVDPHGDCPNHPEQQDRPG